MRNYIVSFIFSLNIGMGAALADSAPVGLSLLSLQGVVLPEMATISDVKTKKETFFSFLEPIVAAVNTKIEAERAWLAVVEARILNDEVLEQWQVDLLEQLALHYRVDEDLGSRAFFDQLFERVDTIPVSLVLAQAANESAWGTSRFATEGNNLFGQWCFTAGCGLIPAGRDSGAKHEVKVFASVTDSVVAYFRNINTHRQYRSFREIRAEYRFLGMPLDSTALAWGLEGYSIRGELYIHELIEMIRHNRLQQRDVPAFYALAGLQIALD